MDPQATLLRILDAYTEQDSVDFAEACVSLDEWLDKGGFAPTMPNLPREITGFGTGLYGFERDAVGWRFHRYDSLKADGTLDKSWGLMSQASAN